MQRGPKPGPPELKIAKGERRDRINARAPHPVEAPPDCPDHLDDKAREEWPRITAELAQLGVLSRTDRSAIALYCDCYSEWVRAKEEVKELGMVIRTGLGGVKTNPAISIGRAARAQMHRLLAEFGLTPSARNRVQTTAAAELHDELSDFLNDTG